MAVLAVTLEIPPGLLAINARDTVAWGPRGRAQPTAGKRAPATPQIRKTKAYRAAEAEAYLAVRQAVIAARWRTVVAPCCAMIVTHWPGQDGDVDATAKAVLDALQHGQAVENDRLIGPALLDFTHGNPQPRIDVWLSTTLGELLPLLPWAGP